MKIGKAFPSTYLRAADLDGEDTTVTIEEFAEEEINGEQKPILYFRELEKGLVLNKTNGNSIAQVLGTDETDDWIGQRITLFETVVDYQGKPTPAIRVKLRAPKGQPQAQAAEARSGGRSHQQESRRLAQAPPQRTGRPMRGEEIEDEGPPF